jgi:hypothetical protein
VWDFVNPITSGAEQCYLGGSGGGFGNMIHRAYRYGKDYPGFKGKDLSAKTPLAKACPQFYKIYKTVPAAPRSKPKPRAPRSK